MRSEDFVWGCILKELELLRYVGEESKVNDVQVT